MPSTDPFSQTERGRPITHCCFPSTDQSRPGQAQRQPISDAPPPSPLPTRRRKEDRAAPPRRKFQPGPAGGWRRAPGCSAPPGGSGLRVAHPHPPVPTLRPTHPFPSFPVPCKTIFTHPHFPTPLYNLPIRPFTSASPLHPTYQPTYLCTTYPPAFLLPRPPIIHLPTPTLTNSPATPPHHPTRLPIRSFTSLSPYRPTPFLDPVKSFFPDLPINTSYPSTPHLPIPL